MSQVLAIILAGGAGTRLSVLSEERSKPAVPFAGKYRIIDFTLSNCVNSDIFNVAVLTQYRPHSLNQHIGIGKPWDLDRARGGVRLFQPYQGRLGQTWYSGTADAVYRNWEALAPQKADLMLILSGDRSTSSRVRAARERAGRDAFCRKRRGGRVGSFHFSLAFKKVI